MTGNSADFSAFYSVDVWAPGKATSAYVYTPEGSSVPVLIRGEELDSWLIWDLNDMFQDAYPNATFLGN